MGSIESFYSRTYNWVFSSKARQEMKQLEDQIKKIENYIFLKTTDIVEAKNTLLLLRSRYNDLSASRAASKVLRLKLIFYEYLDKTGRLLAWKIRQQQTERTVTIIESSTGNIVDPVEINEAFRTYYEKLYSSECSINVDIQKQFLDSLNILQISIEEKNKLDEDLTLQEIGEAIDSGRLRAQMGFL